MVVGFYGIDAIMNAELLAVFKALELTWATGYTYVIWWFLNGS